MHPTLTSAYARQREQELRSVTARRPRSSPSFVVRLIGLVRP